MQRLSGPRRRSKPILPSRAINRLRNVLVDNHAVAHLPGRMNQGTTAM
jgi:hypothetical protein